MRVCLRSIFLFVLLWLPHYASAAEKAEEACTKDIYGHNTCLKNGDSDAAAMRIYGLVGRSYDALLQQEPGANKDELFFAPVDENQFDVYSSDKDVGPFIALAKEKKADSVVMLIPSSNVGHEMQGILFKGKDPIFYVAGSTTKALAKSLKEIPKKLPAAAPYFRIRTFGVYADNGTPLTAYKIMYSGAPEQPWPFQETKKPDTSSQKP